MQRQSERAEETKRIEGGAQNDTNTITSTSTITISRTAEQQSTQRQNDGQIRQTINIQKDLHELWSPPSSRQMYLYLFLYLCGVLWSFSVRQWA